MSTSPKQAAEEEVLSTNHSVLQQLSYDYSPDRYKYYLNKPHQDYIETAIKVQKLTANRVGRNVQMVDIKQDDIAYANNTIRRSDSMEDETLLPRIFQPQRLMIQQESQTEISTQTFINILNINQTKKDSKTIETQVNLTK